MLDIKQLQIIDTIIQNPILTKSRMTDQLGLTSRQVDYAIEKLNQHLADHQQPPIDTEGAYVVVPNDAYDYLLTLRASENLTALNHYTLSTSERQLFISLLLSCHDGYLSLIHLQDYLQVSQSTISKDLKALESLLLPYQLHIHYDRQNGYRLDGHENRLRMYLIRTLSTELSKTNGGLLSTCADLIQHVNTQTVFAKITRLTKKYHIDFVENRLLEFGYIYVFMTSRLRIRPEYLPSAARRIDVSETNEYVFAQALLAEDGVTSSTAAEYLATIVLCLSIGGLEHLSLNRYIYDITAQVVQRFSDISGIVFSDQNKVAAQLFTHFRSMYYRLQFNYPITNPLTEQVISEYGEIFTLVSRALQNFVTEMGRVPDEEIAFLTIHLISFIYTADAKKSDNITAAIVCPNGIGNSALAYLQLTNLFPNIKFLTPFRYVDLDAHLAEIDLIFSTFYRSDLFTKDRPCFIINPIMTTDEKYNLIQKVNSALAGSAFAMPTLSSVMTIVDRVVADHGTRSKIRRELANNVFKVNSVESDPQQFHLADVLSTDEIQLQLVADTPQAAMKLAAAPLLTRGVITQGYIENIIDSADKRSPDSYIIAPNVALPHADPRTGAQRVGMSIAVLDHPMAFDTAGKRPVQFIFVLSAVNATDHLTVLQDLLDLLAKPAFLTALADPNQTPAGVLHLIVGK
ncbi:MAG: BglG family transcription antiterminator [Lactobacillus sp.]|jgi:transcriptional antiterminator/mannitol/fructose-specific phosphotransferase system IIA component (Ntr-type)|nr:BglG family transcription antiterminator [Lactobacillus sp.]MCI2034221.1 BglG family transcription antiterminator [Lactobacillus sp.]